ncbi:hypothetical protein LTR85_003389 [Meristemomyces frigidus]|nr:hypothetical protein LTR85_003389 [Meristemomyces frigidus]
MEDLHALKHALSDIPPTDGPKPHLLTLPGELKNRIYRLAVVSGTAVVIASTTPYDDHELDRQPRGATITKTPALLRTCKQLRNEVHKIYFEEISFYFMNHIIYPEAITAFRRMAGTSAKTITSVKVIHPLAMCDSPHLRFSATLVSPHGSEQGIIKISNSKGDEVVQDGRDLGDTGDYCCCNALEVARQYSNPVPNADIKGGVLLAFLADYAKSVQQRKRKFPGPRKVPFRPSGLRCEVCDKIYYPKR